MDLTRPKGTARPSQSYEMGRRAFTAWHHVSYGNHKIRAAPNAKIPTKSPGIRAISMITSWI